MHACECGPLSSLGAWAAKMRNAASVAFMPVDARAAGSGATRVLAAALLLSCSQIEYLMAASPRALCHGSHMTPNNRARFTVAPTSS